jgi:isochorismate synthase
MSSKERAMSAIGTLIESGRSFAMFRMPASQDATLIVQRESSDPLTADSIEWLNDRSGFVMAPFTVSPSHPIVLISPDEIRHFRIPWQKPQGHQGDAYALRPTDKYEQCFNDFVEAISAGKFHKLVLSRKADYTLSDAIDVERVFVDACRRYHHSYIYVLSTPQTGIWIGCTPEVLLTGCDGRYTTMSLAGTQEAPRDGSVRVEWNEKNRREQGYVSDYLRSCLNSYGVSPEESEPRTVKAGELVHLRSDFHFCLEDEERLGSLLKAIHPTPAVCGLPKDEAYSFIMQHEGYDRGYYSGFVGMLNPHNDISGMVDECGGTSLYVNLRCMQVDGSVATLYAGGGLLSSSELNDEWLETERKMATMKRIITSK